MHAARKIVVMAARATLKIRIAICISASSHAPKNRITPLPSSSGRGCGRRRCPPRRASGYKDTPLIPGTPWHVHDGDRPQPRVVTPGAAFSLLAPPPSDAVVLFDGSDLSKWESIKGGEPKWILANGVLEVVPFSGNIRTKQRFGDFQLHLEYAEPAVVKGKGQGRGNSGVLINGMYEVQILDSYNSPTYPDGQAGALYGQTPPLVNACKPPGEWQTYDIIFESPRWDAPGSW